MALKKKITTNNAAADSLIVNNKKIISEYDINVTIGQADAATLYDVGYPFGYNDSTGKHAPWMAPDATVLAIFLGSTPATGGTFDITVNDQVTADIAFDATAAEVDGALKAIGYNTSTVLASDTYTITFDGADEIKVLPTVVGDVADLTGDTASSSTTTDGTATNGTNRVRGFINPNQAQTGITTGSITLSRTASATAVATQDTPHGLTTGMEITVTGADDADYNVTDEAITVTSDYTFTYTSGGSDTDTDSGAYTTTNDVMTTMMVRGVIHADVPEALVATADVSALRTALKDGLVGDGIVVQGLVGRH